MSLSTSVYYRLKPVIPRRVQLGLRRSLAARRRAANAGVWPVLESAAAPPPGWAGWPDGKAFALVLTHDVESAAGQDKCRALMALEKELGFVSSFNFVPERYPVSRALRQQLVANGFEVGVHGLNHDGKLFSSEDEFRQRAGKINDYAGQWGARGFRAPAMHHNLAWIGRYLDVDYDLSTFDTDPFEPQADGVGTIFPFVVQGPNGRSYVEMPYTLPQDHGLFIILGETDIDIWRRKLRWIAGKGGMALLNVHPDYMRFDDGPLGPEEFPAAYYAGFLRTLQEEYSGRYWHALPRQVADFISGRQSDHE
jgi:peptidoglycan/xylan/chitin deacetylase (PgdA/CDA1 family)